MEEIKNPRPFQPDPRQNDPYGCDTPGSLDIRACSSMDCTGLIPALPQTEAELEAYAQMYHYPADVFQD